MKKQEKKPDNAAMLRQKAENQLNIKGVEKKASFSEVDLLKLIHELEVYKIELELQNDELTTALNKASAAEEKYSELYDFAPTGYITVSEDDVIKEINFAAALLLGKDRSVLLKRKLSNYISIKTRGIFNQFIGSISVTNLKQSCEIIIENNNLPPKYVIIEGVLGPHDQLVLLTLLDISKRKAAEIALGESKLKTEESENKFVQLVDNIDECFWLREGDEMLYVSPGFEKIWGIPCQALYDNSYIFMDSIHPNDKPAVIEALQSKEFSQTGYFNQDYRIIRADNEIRWINAKSFPVAEYANTTKRTAGIALDITEKIKQHFDLIHAKEHAEESDRLKSAFLANMSHEIRTPMNGILGFAEILKEPDLSGEEQHKYIGIIEKSGLRMLNIINNIVDISKIEAGLMKLEIKESNINQQLDYIKTFFLPEIEAKGMRLIYNNTLANSDANLQTDREKVYAILTNLVKNAIKYTSKGSIEIGCDLKGDYFEFYVKDTGIGIPKERHEAIFERFIQADIADRQAYQGAGLGLSISQAYVTMLGGKIWVESEEDFGSTFYFTLPKKGIAKAEIILEKEPLVTNETYDISGLKILLVEDDEVSSLLFDFFLNKIGKEVLKATSGTEAVEMCRNNSDIDLILMDVRLPVLSGYEATRLIRKFNKDVFIIAQTAYGLQGERERALKAGCNDYIAKPINKQELMRIIQSYFGKER